MPEGDIEHAPSTQTLPVEQAGLHVGAGLGLPLEPEDDPDMVPELPVELAVDESPPLPPAPEGVDPGELHPVPKVMPAMMIDVKRDCFMPRRYAHRRKKANSKVFALPRSDSPPA